MGIIGELVSVCIATADKSVRSITNKPTLQPSQTAQTKVMRRVKEIGKCSVHVYGIC
jgi:hypothetical protein